MACFVPPRPKIGDSIVDVIGNTPMVRLGRCARECGVVANIILKLESMEPCSSVKDRIAKSMILEAEARGDITPGVTVLVEPTSGNTGIGLAMVAAAKGYQLVVVMPSTLSLERRVMLKALGARLVLTPGEKGIPCSILKAEEIVASLGGRGFMLQQFDNPDNPKVHRETTGPEIWDQCDGKVDFFVGGVGTGGTISGTSQFLKSVNPLIQVVAVEPAESAVLSGGPAGKHKIQGIGAGFVPGNCDRSVIDQIVKVTSDRAIEVSRQLATREGIFVGISAGAAVAAALEIGQKAENAGKNIVVLIPSFGERYLSTPLFADLHAEAVNQATEDLL
ncbi:cysteine synthase [Ochromonadaceae sp. CCMP2298]|nr:cysteine synthase [Ochromonadaceae sp. CCMP2298]|mmetsp:Transcript_33630/g.74129  ORF Transcript_33630/g.74129 Transcript_33630/m.74129 type:complete len:334 (+) Transcript_33630:129-1130(+)